MNAPLRQDSYWGIPIEEMSTSQRVGALGDPFWRLRNLYWIVDKEGNPTLFQPWPEQEKFFAELHYRNIVPKARQRGFSTAVQIMMLDACIFDPPTAAGIIAQDEPTALQIFEKKIKFAWNRMPALIHAMFPVKTNNKHELAWENDSSIYVATSTRGTTLQYLHVSEYGKICAQDPGRANEIQEGSLPSVDQHGVIVIESTVEGNEGNFADMTRTAERVKDSGRPLTPMDYKLHFASWWDAPEYEIDPTHVVISDKDNAYFHRIEGAIGREISLRKRAWYVMKRDSDFGGADEKMWRQYPSTLKEAFTVSSDGLWLSQQMATARVQRRICPLPILRDEPVNTFWDLGVTTDSNCCWLHQAVGPWDHFIGFLETWAEPYSTIVRMLQAFQQEHGIVWGFHGMPHDADQTRPGAEVLKTPRDMFTDLGLKNIIIIPRVADITLGIDQLREDFSTYRIDEQRCAEGIKHLDGFSKVFNPTMKMWTPQIQKNGHQHGADALRQKAQWAHKMRGSSITAGREGSAKFGRRKGSSMTR